MKKEYLLMAGSTLLTLVLALLMIRWLAPQLLGLREDQMLVKTSREVPPFYENVFRRERASDGYLIADPTVGVRATPMFDDLAGLGPNDLLGFRNHAIPNVADVVVIGDSQTYGNNATIDKNWPHLMQAALLQKRAMVYSMATGGWGAAQYLAMFRYSRAFKPTVVVVAFYSGNDPLDSFKSAYSYDEWRFLRPDTSLSISDMPTIGEDAKDVWSVRFANGATVSFTPRMRMLSNDPAQKAVVAGYEIMARAAEMIATKAPSAGVRAVFTVIPTKELVYAPRIRAESIVPSEDYERLVRAEVGNIDALANRIRRLPGAVYVDVVAPLQHAAMGARGLRLYPSDKNGHPFAEGYAVIAGVIARRVEPLVQDVVSRNLTSRASRDGGANEIAQ